VPQTKPGPRPAKPQPRVQRNGASRTAAPAPASIVSRIGAAAPRPRLGGGGPVGSYLREVRSELRKTVWPSREEATKLTLVVIGLSIIVGLYLGLLDLIFSQVVRLILSVSGGA